MPNAVAALQADEAAPAQQPTLQLEQFRGHHHGYFGGGPRFGFGFYGGPYAAEPYYDDDYYGPPVVYGAPAPAGGDVAYLHASLPVLRSRQRYLSRLRRTASSVSMIGDPR